MSFRLSPALVPSRKGSLLIRCSKGFDPNPKPKPKKQKVRHWNISIPLSSSLVSQAPSELVKKDSEDEMPTSTSREIPSYLANRMLGRIAIFSGVPVLIGICLLPVFYYLKVPPTAPIYQSPNPCRPGRTRYRYPLLDSLRKPIPDLRRRYPRNQLCNPLLQPRQPRRLPRSRKLQIQHQKHDQK